MLEKLKALKKRTPSRKQEIDELIRLYKKSESVNNKYGVFFDKVISDGVNAEDAARELELL